MTYQTKAALREEINYIHAQLKDAEIALKGAGYKKKHELGIYAGWYKLKEEPSLRWTQYCDAVERQERDLENAQAKTVATRETLELVLKALEIPGYTSFVFADEDRLGGNVHASRYDTNRFHADLETALRVRAEKKRAAEDAKIEAHVAGLTKKSSGNTFSFSFIPTSGEYDATAPKLADLTPQSETVEKTTKKSKGDKK